MGKGQVTVTERQLLTDVRVYPFVDNTIKTVAVCNVRYDHPKQRTRDIMEKIHKSI